MPRLAPVTSATGRESTSGKRFLYRRRDVFVCEGFDKRVAIDQSGRGMGDASSHAVLVIAVDSRREIGISKCGHRSVARGPVLIRPDGEFLAKVLGRDLRLVSHRILSPLDGESGAHCAEIARGGRRVA